MKRDHKTVGKVRAELEDVGSVPHVETRTDSKGRKQPSRKAKAEQKQIDAVIAKSPRSWDVETPKDDTEASAEQRKAQYAVTETGDDLPPISKDFDTPEDCWQRSLSTLAGDAIAMRALWSKQFGDWEKFKVTADLVTLAEQAAEAWTELASTMQQTRTGAKAAKSALVEMTQAKRLAS